MLLLFAKSFAINKKEKGNKLNTDVLNALPQSFISSDSIVNQFKVKM